MHELAPLEARIQVLNRFEVGVPGRVDWTRSWSCLQVLRFFLNAWNIFLEIFKQCAFSYAVEEDSHDVGVLLKLWKAILKHFALVVFQASLCSQEFLVVVDLGMQ